MCWQSNVPQSSLSRHSAQREHTFQTNEESDDDICYLLGTSEVYQELCLDPRAEILQVPVDSDWADDKETRQSCSGGAVLFHGCAVLTWATYREDERSFESRGRVEWHWLRSNRRSGSSTTFARMAVQNSTAASGRLTERTCGVQAKRAWVHTGRPRIHEVWTHDKPADFMTKAMTREKLIKFGRALNLRGSFSQTWAKTCTVTSVTPITETLTVEMNTVNSLFFFGGGTRCSFEQTVTL